MSKGPERGGRNGNEPASPLSAACQIGVLWRVIHLFSSKTLVLYNATDEMKTLNDETNRHSAFVMSCLGRQGNRKGGKGAYQ